MTVLASIRPDSWDFPLFLHVLGAMILTRGLLTGVSSLAFARGDVRFLRLGAPGGEGVKPAQGHARAVDGALGGVLGGRLGDERQAGLAGQESPTYSHGARLAPNDIITTMSTAAHLRVER
jgi:hypothetical protein